MKKFIFALLCSLCVAASLYGQTKAEKTAEEFIATEKKRSEAIAANDIEFLNKLYSDDFRGVTAIGFEVNKEILMNVFKRDDPNTKFELDRLQARVYGKTAVVTGRLVGKKTETGEIVHQSLFIHVYVKRGGRWQIVAGQGTMIQPQPATQK